MCKDPRCDGTRLGHDLFLLELEDPAVAAAAERLRDTIDRITHPEDHVIAANLQVDDPTDPSVDPWGHGRNPLGCCGDRRSHGGPGCRWPG